jgi:2-amino-4-hydroxy-6-hydroxymethyldihydropteridine diphosphokinase
MIEVLVALGSNKGDSRGTLNRAIALFCEEHDVRLLRRSSDYRTPPWGVTDQPAFINACLLIATALSPHMLLERAQRVEQELGRDRSRERRWGPRPIDIDLLAYDDVAVDEPGLKLPHPHLFERAFVLVPLVEIAPDWVIGGTNVRDALTRIDRSGIERLS